MSKSFYKKTDITTIISLAQSGNIKALEELIRRVQKHIFTMFSYLTNKSSEVAYLTQETLLKMAKNLQQLKDTKNFKPWLNQIITNTFYDYSKKYSDKFIEIDENKLNEIKDKINSKIP